MITNLVISGGGISGIGILGILQYLNKRKILQNIKNYTGTSVGSLLSFALIIGFDTKELYYLMIYFDFSKIIFDISLNTFIDKWGFTSMKKLKYFLIKILEYKGFDKHITFKELYKKTNKFLNLTGSCINDSKCYYFNYKTEPNMSVVKAVLISCCIPIVFTPIKYKNRIWLDGGLFNNYPISYHKKDLKHTLGICIYDECYKTDNKLVDIENYLLNVFKCIAFGQSHNTSHNYNDNTINFVHLFNNNYGFKIAKNTKNELFKLGYDNAVRQKHKIDSLLKYK